MKTRITDALLAAFIAAVLFLPLMGVRTIDGLNGLTAEWHLDRVAVCVAVVFLGRLLMTGLMSWRASRVAVREANPHLAMVSSKLMKFLPLILIVGALVLPLTPLASRYAMDVMTMLLTYIVLAAGLNITIGYAGLLDLGYVAFYALGAYGYALLNQYFGLDFWQCLPLCGVIAAVVALLLGLPVLRLRGDYFAIVTLGFGEVLRLVIINWTSLTGGPNGISGIPRPTLFGLEFARTAGEGHKTFSEFFGLEFDQMQRVAFVYYVILALALLVIFISTRLRRLPLGRAWESFREDEIACAALGINRWRIKLAAYALGAMVASLAGAFFATRQAFISPESFTFAETGIILAIIILGGMGSPLGIVFATAFIIGLPELFRELEQFRMIAFGLGMVLIMIWRPGGLMSKREPTARLNP